MTQISRNAKRAVPENGGLHRQEGERMANELQAILDDLRAREGLPPVTDEERARHKAEKDAEDRRFRRWKRIADEVLDLQEDPANEAKIAEVERVLGITEEK
jgi:hypothetical protein